MKSELKADDSQRMNSKVLEQQQIQIIFSVVASDQISCSYNFVLTCSSDLSECYKTNSNLFFVHFEIFPDGDIALSALNDSNLFPSLPSKIEKKHLSLDFNLKHDDLKKSITVTRFIVLFMTTGYLWLCLNTI
jgi:hypothetical protein